MAPNPKLIKAGDATRSSDAGREMSIIDQRLTGAPEVWFARVVVAGGVTIPRHTHTADTIAYLAAGRAIFRVGMDGEKQFELGPGDCMYMPAGVIHAEESIGDEEAVFLVARDRAGGETVPVAHEPSEA